MEIVKEIYKKWCSIDDKIRFIFIGGVNAGISYIIFALLLFILGSGHLQICIAGQWILSSPFSYLNQKFFVFCTKGNYIKEYLKCWSTWIVSYFLNAIICELLIRYLIKNEYISQLLSIFIVSIVTYILFKHFAFKVKNKI